MSRFERAVRILYAAIALLSALAIHLSGPPAYAQDALRPFNEESRLYDRLDRQDERMAKIEISLTEIESENSYIKGIGEGGMAALGVLQIVGLLAKRKETL